MMKTLETPPVLWSSPEDRDTVVAILDELRAAIAELSPDQPAVRAVIPDLFGAALLIDRWLSTRPDPNGRNDPGATRWNDEIRPTLMATWKKVAPALR